jgi:hypothetical protein
MFTNRRRKRVCTNNRTVEVYHAQQPDFFYLVALARFDLGVESGEQWGGQCICVFASGLAQAALTIVYSVCSCNADKHHRT